MAAVRAVSASLLAPVASDNSSKPPPLLGTGLTQVLGMLIRLLGAFAILVLAACGGTETTPALERGWAPAGACVFVGNRADDQSCATTGTQLLANPQTYDGRRISVRGWAVVGVDHSDKPVVWLYLTQDAVEAEATHSVVVLEGSALPEIVAFLERQQGELLEPRRVGVTGDFEVFKPDASGSRRKESPACCRFGIIRSIRGWRP